MTRRLPPRVLLVGALLLAGLGGVAAATVDDAAPPLTVAATGGDGDAPSPSFRAGAAPSPSSTTTATAAPTTAVTTPGSTKARAAGSPSTTRPTSTTAARAPGSATATTLDWRAAGLPGPVGSTVQPWTEAPYDRSAQGPRTTITTHAARNGAVPGTTMPLTVTATWTQYDLAGAIVLIGPSDPTKPYEQQPRQVLASWSLEACDIFAPSPSRTVTVDLAMRKIVKPEFTMNNLEYDVQVLRTPCEQNFQLGVDSWVHLSFNVNEPWVVRPPGPPLGRTG